MMKRPVAGAALALLAAVALAGCASSPPEHFYTLSGGPGPVAAPLQARATPQLYVEVGAVSVPPQVSRNQLVVLTGSGVDILEQERWAGPLAAEIGQALSLGITGALGAIDVYHTPYPAQAPVYRVSTSVQRFESAPGQYALIDAVWSVRQLSSGTVLTCRTVAREPVGAGYEALVAGHRLAVARVAAAVSTAIGTMAAGGETACPASS